jgi:lectin-like protein/PEP-CTERM motif-containing protein
MKTLIRCFASVCLVSPMVASAFVPVQWSVNGHYYEVVNPTSGMTWPAAKALAESSQYLGANGHLATITSAAENSFVQSILPAGVSTFGYYLGGSQLPGSVEPDQGWVWSTAEPFSFINWNPAEPNDGYAGRPQGVLWMWSDYATAYSGGTWMVGKWDDTWDDFTEFEGALNSYVIEYAVPEPTTFSLLSAGALFAAFRASRRKR